jgi:hypothetical protein
VIITGRRRYVVSPLPLDDVEDLLSRWSEVRRAENVPIKFPRPIGRSRRLRANRSILHRAWGSDGPRINTVPR